MIKIDDITGEIMKKHNLNLPQTLDYPYIILIIGSFVSWKTNVLLNLISQQVQNDKIYLCTKDPNEEK